MQPSCSAMGFAQSSRWIAPLITTFKKWEKLVFHFGIVDPHELKTMQVN